MTIPASGPLNSVVIQNEFGGITPNSLSEYYEGGTYVPNGATGTIPTTGAIKFSDFYGAGSIKLGLVSWWEFEETTGTSGIADSTTNNDLSGTQLSFSPGIVGNATQLNTPHGKLSPVSLPGGANARITLGFWYRSVSGSLNSSIQISSVVTPNTCFLLNVNNSGATSIHTTFTVHVLTSNFPTTYTATNLTTTTGDPVSTQWNFVIAWYDGTNLNVSYNNGSTFTVAAPGVTGGGFRPSTGGQLTIQGSAQSGSAPFIDQAFIYNRVLTSGERQVLYNNGAGRSFASL